MASPQFEALITAALLSIMVTSSQIQHASAQGCFTVSGPRPFAPCMFPFGYRNTMYWGCPVDPDDPTKTWCSTKVDFQRNHIINQGEYGHCDDNCPKHVTTSARSAPLTKRTDPGLSSACFTVGGPNPNRPCIFPFIYDGAEHYGCLPDPEVAGKFWCSTKVDVFGHHVPFENEYGFCHPGCPLAGKPGGGPTVANDLTRPPSSVAGIRQCRTIGGPNPNQPCVLPFIYLGHKYEKCPIDPDNPSKHWCSTKVDALGQHVINQGEYGHCADYCPLDKQPGFGVGGKPPSKRSDCPGSKICMGVIECPSMYRKNGENCHLIDGSYGRCCPLLSANRQSLNNLGFQSSASFVNPFPVSNSVVTRALHVGEGILQNLTRVVRTHESLRSGTPSFFHSRNQKQNLGVSAISDLAIISNVAADSIRNFLSFERSGTSDFNSVDFSRADTRNTMLDKECPRTDPCIFNSKYRTADGSCNNLREPKYGLSKTPLLRLIPNSYHDGAFSPKTNLPLARYVSGTMVDRSSRKTGAGQTVALMSFGQFLDHDLTHVPIEGGESANGIDCCNDDGIPSVAKSFVCFPMLIPPDDPVMKSTCMNFVRSVASPALDCHPGPREQMNQLTHWMDGSQVYGSDDREARRLREFRGGFLKTSTTPRGESLLPISDDNSCGGRCFLSGDSRNSEQPYLTVIHTLFMREHNRVAHILHELNPHWNDEILYQEAKRIIVAELQHIVLNEWLPVILGHKYMTENGMHPLSRDAYSRDYDPNVDPRISNAFAAAAFRFGHSLVPQFIRMVRKPGNGPDLLVPLRRAFMNTALVQEGDGFNDILRGMLKHGSERMDNSFTEELVDFLFSNNGPGQDLIATNIQRSRDHGLPGYIKYRNMCSQRQATTFADLTDNIPLNDVNGLRAIYPTVDDIDLFVGLVMEEPDPRTGALVGNTLRCLIGDQFNRLKKGDRYFYDLQGQAGSFSSAQLREIRKSSLARIICDNNLQITELQPMALWTSDVRNPLVSCETMAIPFVNLSPWKE